MSLTATAVAVMISAAAPQATVPVATDGTAPATSAAVPVPVDAVPADTTPAVDAAAAPASTAVPTGTASDPQGSDIIVTPRKPPPPGDPLERINEQSFKTVQSVDKAVIGPVATAYNKGLPRPIRQGLRNFFLNLQEPVVFAAYLLEFKPGKAAETAGRFAINTTLGVGGVLDTAKRKPFNLPYRPNGLADLLGYYGVGPGPYMYLPLIGATTLRDVIGDTVDQLAVPTLIGKPFTNPAIATPASIISQLGERAAFDSQIRKIRDSENPYATYRELYLKQRKAEIEALHGRVTAQVDAVYGPGMRTQGGKPPADAATAPASGSDPK
jgi:phospholipid-binding lipoprotein MlaA